MNDLIDGPNAQGDLELSTLFKVLWRRRWLIIISTVVCAAALVAVAFIATPVYRAETVLVPGDAEKRMGGLGSMLGQFGGLAAIAGLDVGSTGSMTEEALAVLRSRGFTESFLREEGVMPLLFASRWDSANKGWKGPASDHPTYAQGYKHFDRKVRKVAQDKKRGLILIQIEWRDRAVAAHWANQLVKRLNAEMRARAIAQTDASVSFLERELAATNVVETREAVSRLMEAQVNQRMYANVTQEYAFRVVDPALEPDVKDVVWPNKPLLLLLGMFLGAFVGISAAFVQWRFGAGKAARAVSPRVSETA
jgi:capsular polysaccharide biosynthesis protein